MQRFRHLHSSCEPFVDPRPQHIASNAYTRYRPFPTPAQFTASPDLISRMTIFLRRELQVWPNLDVEVSFHSGVLYALLIALYSIHNINLSHSFSQPTRYP